MGEDLRVNRRTALQTLGACGIGTGSIGVMSGRTRAAKFETVSIPDVPTKPEKQVYSFVDNEYSTGSEYEISHTMEWFRSTYNNQSGKWEHDFSIQSHAYSKHSEYSTLTPECTGWGYRIESEDGFILPYVNEEMHGVNPGGVTGGQPGWVDVVMEGALGTLNGPASILYTAEKLRNIMDPADGFDTGLDNGFRWLKTYDYGEDAAEQVSSHHRVQLESSMSAPFIDTNATVRIKHDPFGDDKWLDMEVRTHYQDPVLTPNSASTSDTQSSSTAHPEDMSAEEIELLGIKKVEDVEKTSVSNNYSISRNDDPDYVMTNCPWSADVETTIVKENRDPTE